MATTVSKLLNTGVLQTAGEIDEFSLDQSNQGSIFFNGTGYLTVPTSSFLNATNTYTIEMWINIAAYPTSTNSAVLYQVTNANTTNYGGLSVELYGAGNIRFQCRPSTGGTNVSLTTFRIIPQNVWTHVAVVVNNGYAVIYINGVQSGISTVVALDNTQTFCSVGYLNNGNITSQTYFSGYMTNLRVVKNQAIYPVISELTAISGTTLLTAKSSSLTVDNSSTYPIIKNLGVTSSNTIIPFDGTYSNYFNSAFAQYLTASSSTGFAFGTGDYTIECWVNVIGDGVGRGRLFSFSDSNDTFELGIGSVSSYAGITSTGISLSNGPNGDAWNHIAAVRNSGIVTVYLNGYAIITTTNTTNVTSARSMFIGRGGIYYNGYISNFRVVKGTAVYTSNFPNSLPTSPLTAISGTSLLTCQTASPFTDVSNNTTITLTPVPVTTTNSVIPFASGTYSGSFNGTTTYLSVTNNEGLKLTTGDCTIEFWMQPTSLVAGGIYAKRAGSGNFAQFFIAMQATGRLNVAVSNAAGTAWTINDTASMPVMSINTWYHVAVVRNGNNIQAYVNGTQYINSVAITSVTVIFDDAVASNLIIGANAVTPTTYFAGYISNLRVVKGTAVYTGAFSGSVPTTALTSITNTTLLTLQTTFPIVDNTLNNNSYIGNVGGVTTSTSIVPFAGAYSYAFNGSSQYLNLPVSNFLSENIVTIPDRFNTYTIEMWINPTAYPGGTNWCPLYQVSNANITNFGYLAVELYGTGVIRLEVKPNTGGTLVTLATTSIVPLGVWTHVAVNVFRGYATIYLNGYNSAFGSTVVKLDGTQVFSSIGRLNNGFVTSQTYYNGYISNLRVVKNKAIYPNNFNVFVPPQTQLQTTQSSDTNIAAISSATSVGVLLKDFDDSSTYTLPITKSGSTLPSISYRLKLPFENNNYNDRYGSVYFDGLGARYNFNTASNVSTFGDIDYTAEAWVYIRSDSFNELALYAGNGAGMFGTQGTSGGVDYYVYADVLTNTTPGQGTNSVFLPNGGKLGVRYFQYNTWYHIAFVKAGGFTKVYVNGIEGYSNSGSVAGTVTLTDWNVGASAYSVVGTASGVALNISNMRVVKGRALYTSNFTPSTKPLSVIPGTILLTAQSPINLKDSSGRILYGNISTVASPIPSSLSPFTSTGNITVSKQYSNGTLKTLNNIDEVTLNPNFNNKGSVFFNNTSYNIPTYVTNDPMTFGKYTDFTIEAWLYNQETTIATEHGFFEASPSTLLDANLYQTGGIKNSQHVFSNGSAVQYYAPVIPVLNTWYHYALVRKNNVLQLFINGQLAYHVDDYTVYNNRAIVIGAYNGAYWKGYISNFRVVKGKAVYSKSMTYIPNKFDLSSSALSTTSSEVSITKLLTAQSSTIIDNSTKNPNYIYNSASPVVSTNSVIPFAGTYSYQFTAASSQYLTINNFYDAAAARSTSFTMECFVYVNSFTTGSIATNAFGTYVPYTIGFFNGTTPSVSGTFPFFGSYGSTNGTWSVLSSPNSLSTSTWYHFAVSYDGTTTRLFIDGVLKASSTTIAYGIGNITNNTFYIGKNWTTANYFDGYISNFRFIKGNSIYNSAFSKPTSALTEITSTFNTTFLTAQSSSIVDNSANSIKFNTDNINYIPTTYAPFAGSYSYSYPYDNASSLYVEPNSTSSSSFTFGTGDFTIEFWASLSTGIQNTTIMGVWDGTAGNSQWVISSATSLSITNIKFSVSDGTTITSYEPTVNMLNTIGWKHIVIVRNSGVLKIFSNGVLVLNVSLTTNFISTTSSFRIGPGYFGGYISNLRITKGQALYTTSVAALSYNVPSSSLSSITNTKLLTAQSSTIIDNSSLSAVITNNGAVTTTNSVIPFAGTYSYQFNGIDQYLTIPYSYDNYDWWGDRTALGSIDRDYTLEAWIYTTTTTGWYISNGLNDIPTLIRNGDYNTGTFYWAFGINSSGQVAFYYDTQFQNYFTSTATINLNAWNHIGLVKSDGRLILLVNGVMQSFLNLNDTGPRAFETTPLTIGAGNNSYINGYVSNLRIVKGISAALYNHISIPTGALTTTSQGATASNVSLLTAQNSTFIDNSNNNYFLNAKYHFPITTNSVIPFAGTYSTKLDGVSNYITLTRNDNYGFEADFTIECFINFNDPISNFAPLLAYTNDDVNTYQGWRLLFGSSNIGSNYQKLMFEWFGGSAWSGLGGGYIQSDVIVVPQIWNHVVVVRSGTTLNMYLNGVATATTTLSRSLAVTTYATYPPLLRIGAQLAQGVNYGSSPGYNGYISNVRLIKGSSLYNYGNTVGTTYFTPPTSALTTTSQGATPSQVSLLTCQDSTFIDNSNNAALLRLHPGAIVDRTVIPFAGTYSYYFHGGYPNSTYAQTLPNSAFLFGTNDFTIEFWAYPTLATQDNNTPMLVIFDHLVPYSSSTANGREIRISQNLANGGFGMRLPSDNVGTGTDYNTGYTLPINTWHFIKLVRINNLVKLYLNGKVVIVVPQTSFNFGAQNTITNGYPVYPSLKLGNVSQTASDSFYTGYISNLRITNGDAIITKFDFTGGNFTPSTSPLQLTQSSGTNINEILDNETTLLLSSNYIKASDDSLNNQQLIASGSPPTASYQSPFASVPSTSYYSGKFNGTNNYLNVSGTTFSAIGTADFTIEAFIYLTVSNITEIIDFRPSGTITGVYPNLYINSLIPRYYVSGADRIVGSTLDINIWYHIAVVRISSVTKMYVNGVQVGAAYADSNSYLSATNRPTIGASAYDLSSKFPGYISNLRVAVGVGVYTGPFIPPTSTLQTTQAANGHIAAITGVQTKLLALNTSNILTDSSGINTLVNTNSVLSVNATEPSLLLFPPSTAPTVSANTTLMKQYKNGELKVLNYVDEYTIRG